MRGETKLGIAVSLFMGACCVGAALIGWGGASFLTGVAALSFATQTWGGPDNGGGRG